MYRFSLPSPSPLEFSLTGVVMYRFQADFTAVRLTTFIPASGAVDVILTLVFTHPRQAELLPCRWTCPACTLQSIRGNQCLTTVHAYLFGRGLERKMGDVNKHHGIKRKLLNADHEAIVSCVPSEKSLITDFIHIYCTIETKMMYDLSLFSYFCCLK